MPSRNTPGTTGTDIPSYPNLDSWVGDEGVIDG